MVNYGNSKIYKIVCNITGEVYIGSTTNTLCKRLDGHKTGYKLYLKTGKNPISSYPIIARGDYYIVLIKECPCDNKEQLFKYEREHIEGVDCVNKMKRPIITEEERAESKKEYNKEYIKEYREHNADKIKEYYKQNADKFKEYYKQNADKIKEYGKQYREQNADKIKEYMKEYRERNKDKI